PGTRRLVLHHQPASTVADCHRARLPVDQQGHCQHLAALRNQRGTGFRRRRCFARCAICRGRRRRRRESRGSDQPRAAATGSARVNETETVAQSPLDIRSAALTILAVIAVILVLQYAQPMLIPVVLGVLINYALDPVVGMFERVRVPRPLGAVLVLGLLVAGGGVLV